MSPKIFAYLTIPFILVCDIWLYTYVASSMREPSDSAVWFGLGLLLIIIVGNVIYINWLRRKL